MQKQCRHPSLRTVCLSIASLTEYFSFLSASPGIHITFVDTGARPPYQPSVDDQLVPAYLLAIAARSLAGNCSSALDLFSLSRPQRRFVYNGLSNCSAHCSAALKPHNAGEREQRPADSAGLPMAVYGLGRGVAVLARRAHVKRSSAAKVAKVPAAWRASCQNLLQLFNLRRAHSTRRRRRRWAG